MTANEDKPPADDAAPARSEEPIERELTHFLERKTPAAYCVTGPWGTGKTFLWQNVILPRARDLPYKPVLPDDLPPGEFDYRYYSYVSLFNINSIQELKRAIFDARLPRDRWWKPLTDEDVKRNWRTNLFFTGKVAVAALRFGSLAEEVFAKLANGIWGSGCLH